MPLAVCATPIGNLDDVTLRVLAELRDADLVLAEDTRHTRGLLERHGIRARLLSYHEHNEAARVAELLPRLAAGERIALVTDAGLPGISDPGRAARARGARRRRRGDRAARGRRRSRRRSSRAGSAASAYAFVGFLPRGRASSRRSGRELARWALAGRSRSSRRSGCRATLRSLAAVDPEREVAVCRELTKRFEEVVRGTAARARGALRRAAEGRDHARRSGRRRAGDGRPSTRRVAAVAELVAAGTPRRRRRRGRRAADGRCPATTSTAALCDNSVISFDNDATAVPTVV